MRASSDLSSLAAAVPLPAPLPGRSAIASVSLPAFGGTSSRRSLPVFGVAAAVPVVVFGAGVFAGGGVVAFGSGFAPVSATSVGFVAAPPRQSSICECTWAAASLAEPTALI